MLHDPLGLASEWLVEARAKIEAARVGLAQLDVDDETVRRALVRLERVAAELEKIEGVVGEVGTQKAGAGGFARR